jgi:hypothetical protein
MFTFNFKYFLCATVLFITEVLIAAFMHDNFIRPTFGDFLVVILMYCGLKSFIRANYRTMAIAVLLIAYCIEVSQYFHLIVHLGLKHSRPAQWILGNGFSWGDMLAYTLGVLLIWIIESRRENNALI